MTTLQAGRSRLQIQAETRDFSVLQNVHTGSEDHPASFSVGTGVLSRGVKRLGRDVDTHLYLVPSVGASGAIPLLPINAYVVWKGVNILF